MKATKSIICNEQNTSMSKMLLGLLYSPVVMLASIAVSASVAS